ncbi:MAG: GAF domain-containing protein, partial [Salinibacter sp.]
MSYPVPANEPERLEALRRLNILDTDPEAPFDHITDVVQQLFDVRYATVTLLSSDRQWFKASCGLDVDETPREHSFCTYAILDDETLVVEDATADERFTANPLVTGAMNIRFYAGVPLSIDGVHVGALCVFDDAPRRFSDTDRILLEELAEVTANMLRARLQAYEVGYLTSALEQVDEPVCIIEGNPETPSDARLAWANEAYVAMSGTDKRELEHTTPWIFENLTSDPEVEDRVRRALKRGESVRGETAVRVEDREPHFAWVLAPVRHDDQITHWAAVLWDITEQRRIRRKLRTHRNRLQRMQEVAQIGGWEYYPEADAFAGSEQLYHLLGLPEDTDFDLERAFQFYPPAVRDRVKTATRRCLDDGAPFDLEVPLVAATDQRREVRIRGAARREEGRTIRMTGTIQDITARKQRERHLKQANTLFEHAQEAFILFDLDPAGDELNFTVQRVNP